MYYCDGYDEYLKSMKRRCRHLDADEKAAEAKSIIGQIANTIGTVLKFCFKLLKKLAVVAFDTVTFLPKVYILSWAWISCREAQLGFFLLEKLCGGLTWLLEKMRLEGASKVTAGGRDLFRESKEIDRGAAERIGEWIKNVRKPWTAITGTR